MKFVAVALFTFDKGAGVALGGVGGKFDEHVQQLFHANRVARIDVRMGRGEADGHEMPFAQGLLERRVQLLGLDLALFEVGGHELFIDFDDLINQCGVQLLRPSRSRFRPPG